MSKLKVCVIGTGAAGLVCIRHLAATTGVNVIAYEMSAHIGGVWVHNKSVDRNAHYISPMYRDLITNLPKEIMGFLDYPFTKGQSSFVTHEEVHQYLKDYADHFKLKNYIHFNKRVQFIKPVMSGGKEEDHSSPAGFEHSYQPSQPPPLPHHKTENVAKLKWKVTLQHVKSKEQNGSLNSFEENEEEFDYIFVCNGHFYQPSTPHVENIELFRGEVLHSREYRIPEVFEKKKVIIVGSGPSGSDISIQIASYALQVTLCSRNPLKAICLPTNLHVELSTIVKADEEGLYLSNGKYFKCDVVIFSTGYKYEYPFLPSLVVQVENGKRVESLHRHMIHCNYPSLCFVGIPQQTCPFVLFDCQARYLICYIKGKLKRMNEPEMRREKEEDEQIRKEMGLNSLSRSHSLASLQWEYYNRLAQEANFSELLIPVVRKIYEKVWERRSLLPTIYRKDIVRIIDDENFEYIEAPTGTT